MKERMSRSEISKPVRWWLVFLTQLLANFDRAKYAQERCSQASKETFKYLQQQVTLEDADKSELKNIINDIFCPYKYEEGDISEIKSFFEKSEEADGIGTLVIDLDGGAFPEVLRHSFSQSDEELPDMAFLEQLITIPNCTPLIFTGRFTPDNSNSLRFPFINKTRFTEKLNKEAEKEFSPEDLFYKFCGLSKVFSYDKDAIVEDLYNRLQSGKLGYLGSSNFDRKIINALARRIIDKNNNDLSTIKKLLKRLRFWDTGRIFI
jgi:hypothetical protein